VSNRTASRPHGANIDRRRSHVEVPNQGLAADAGLTLVEYQHSGTRTARLMPVSDDDRAAHDAFVATIKDAVWRRE
jgi:hypothetical protein